VTDIIELVRRIERTEARQAIGELPSRYAIAIDSRDIDSWVNLFIEDVDCGKHGKGREVLRTFIEPSVKTFYRSIHQICGQTINFLDDDAATGTVYCRAEHEDGDRWVVMAIIYFDHYVRNEGQWYFKRRHEKHWYSADVLERPTPPFQLWEKWASRLPDLPGDFPTWQPFWNSMQKDDLANLTRQA